jgi:hypothetical protein
MVAGVRNDDTDGKKMVFQIIDLKDLALFRRIEGFGRDGDLFLRMDIDSRVRCGFFRGRRIGFGARKWNDADEEKIQGPQASQSGTCTSAWSSLSSCLMTGRR